MTIPFWLVNSFESQLHDEISHIKRQRELRCHKLLGKLLVMSVEDVNKERSPSSSCTAAPLPCRLNRCHPIDPIHQFGTQFGTMCEARTSWWYQPIQNIYLIEIHWIYLGLSSYVQWTHNLYETRLTDHILMQKSVARSCNLPHGLLLKPFPSAQTLDSPISRPQLSLVEACWNRLGPGALVKALWGVSSHYWGWNVG